MFESSKSSSHLSSEIAKFNALLPKNESRVWRDVCGYEGCYMVSDDGHVGSISRVVERSSGAPRRLRTRILKRIKSANPVKRWVATIKLCSNGACESVSVAQVLLRAFVGEAPPGTRAHVVGKDPGNISLHTVKWALHKDLGMLWQADLKPSSDPYVPERE